MTKYIFISLALVVAFVSYFLVVGYFFPNMETRGQFGDTFGALTAFFSAFAFAGLIYTIYLQRTELSLQREELALTRKELKRSAEAQEKSQKELSKQAASLKLTARLNGYSSLLQLYISRRDVGIAQYGSGGVDKRWDDKASEIETKIQSIIDEKE